MESYGSDYYLNLATLCFLCRQFYTRQDCETTENRVPEECLICRNNCTRMLKLPCGHKFCETCIDVSQNKKEEIKKRERERVLERERLRPILFLQREQEKRLANKIEEEMFKAYRTVKSGEDPDVSELSQLILSLRNRVPLLEVRDNIRGVNVRDENDRLCTVIDDYTFNWLGMECVWVKNLYRRNNEWALVYANADYSSSSRHYPFSYVNNNTITPPPPLRYAKTLPTYDNVARRWWFPA